MNLGGFDEFELTCVLFFRDRPDKQNLFPIVQGGLDVQKREECAKELIEREVPGFAIGGLSGGEAKEEFWKMVCSNQGAGSVFPFPPYSTYYQVRNILFF